MKLSELTDSYSPEDIIIPEARPLPTDIRRVVIDTSDPVLSAGTADIRKPENSFWSNVGMAGVEDKSGVSEHPVIKKLFGLGGEERYQLWPEKIVREGLSAAGDVLAGKVPTWSVDPETGELTTSSNLVEKANAISALAGTGGLMGTTDATLGATPFLRPALKHKEKLYKGKPGQEHQDIIPKELYDDFTRKAMAGEDLAEYNFGFMNDKGHFLTREKALEYGIANGIIDPHAGKFGTLTSTMFADSSKPSMAIEAVAKAKPMESLIAKKSNVQMSKDTEVLKNPSEKDFRNLAKASSSVRTMTDAEGNLYAWDGFNGTHEGIANSLGLNVKNWGNDWFSANGKIYQKGDLKEGYPEWLTRIGSNVLKADASKEAAAIEAVKPAFFSAVEHTVKNIPQGKMTGDQWLGTLTNKPGVKPEEMDWTGLRSFLEENKGKPVTKAQIEEHLAANKIELKEIKKGENDPNVRYMKEIGIAKELHTPEDIAHAKLYNSNFRETVKGMSDDEILKLARKSELEENQPTKYHSYQLPGGENYREMLLTLPERQPKAFIERDKFVNELKDKYGKDTWDMNMSQEEGAKFKQLQDEYFKAKNADEYNPSNPYKSSHWDEPNILAHVRMNDRNIDGKKSLHLEEVQSDWHQQGRDKGYRVDPTEVQRIVAERLEPNKQFLPQEVIGLDGKVKVEWATDSQLRHWVKEGIITDAEANSLLANVGGVPDAPFKKTWHELALKRMIREAAEKGYDRLSWTPGEAQAARYDLSKQINDLKVVRSVDGKGYTIDGTLKGRSDRTRLGDNIPEDKLADTVGKEMAQKIKKDIDDAQYNRWGVKNKVSGNWSQRFASKAEAEAYQKSLPESIRGKTDVLEMAPKYAAEYSGLDLKVGGEGMKGFYDQIIPKALEKIGKEHGVKVQKGDLGKGAAPKIEMKKQYTTGAGDEAYGIYENGKLIRGDMLKDEATQYFNGYKESAADRKSVPVFYIDIPQSLRDTAMRKGFPLFSNAHPGYTFIPVDGDPFENR